MTAIKDLFLKLPDSILVSFILCTILLVQLLNVYVRHRFTLSNFRCFVFWNNSPFSVAGERLVRIVHHTVVIVGESKGAARLVFDKIIPLPHFNVVPHNLHIVIAVSGTLLVEEAQRMNEFMDDGALPHASLAQRVSLQIQVLHIVLKADL